MPRLRSFPRTRVAAPVPLAQGPTSMSRAPRSRNRAAMRPSVIQSSCKSVDANNSSGTSPMSASKISFVSRRSASIKVVTCPASSSTAPSSSAGKHGFQRRKRTWLSVLHSGCQVSALLLKKKPPYCQPSPSVASGSTSTIHSHFLERPRKRICGIGGEGASETSSGVRSFGSSACCSKEPGMAHRHPSTGWNEQKTVVRRCSSQTLLRRSSFSVAFWRVAPLCSRGLTGACTISSKARDSVRTSVQRCSTTMPMWSNIRSSKLSKAISSNTAALDRAMRTGSAVLLGVSACVSTMRTRTTSCQGTSKVALTPSTLEWKASRVLVM
mmetsp:Transcript_107594/g.347215  ORF Transcript_107594/g.347215 Transcript_107594/m.347215 type:complete len:326 (+) Transcript_107594:421-1398(+)